MTTRPDAPITAEEGLGWFEAANVIGSTLESVTPFVLALEQWRRYSGEHGADSALQRSQRRLAEIRKVAGRLNSLIADASRVPDYGPVLARAPEVADLAAALAKFNAAVPAPPRNRPPAGAVIIGDWVRGVLDRVIPADAPERARRRILRDALLRLGFDQSRPPHMFSSVRSLDDLAGLIVRRRKRKGKIGSPKK